MREAGLLAPCARTRSAPFEDDRRKEQVAVNNQQMKQGMGSPISNEAYDVLTALHNKLEGMDAYSKYAKDGRPELWQQLNQMDHQAVTVLCDHLEKLVKDGRLRAA
jgi:hypothetical protein